MGYRISYTKQLRFYPYLNRFLFPWVFQFSQTIHVTNHQGDLPPQIPPDLGPPHLPNYPPTRLPYLLILSSPTDNLIRLNHLFPQADPSS